MDTEIQKYEEAYSEQSLWEKLKKYALMIGREVVEKALLLYFVLQDAETPQWAKNIIYGALGYLIVPLDAIPDFTPVAGYADDLGALVLALSAVAIFVTPEVKEKARQQLKTLFGEK